MTNDSRHRVQCVMLATLLEAHRVAFNIATHDASVRGEHDFEAVMSQWRAASAKLEAGIHQLRCGICLTNLQLDMKAEQ